MNLSLSWLFDHIDADWQKIDIAALVNLFNKKTAEIEGYTRISLDFSVLAAGRIQKIESQSITVHVPEWKQTITLGERDCMQINQTFIIARSKDNKHRWGMLADFGSQKDGLLPALKMEDSQLEGSWKKALEKDDIILHVDNKSINHRPDMWGHRGVAREFAALLDLPLKPLEPLLQTHSSKEYELKSDSHDKKFSISIENPEACKRFAGLYLKQIDAAPSIAWMAARLARVDSRAINAIVDATNYVMLDLGQPMHAFDAQKIKSDTLVIRNAKNKETITLLDGTQVPLSAEDCVVGDGKNPLSLAGIMGGKDTCVDASTTSIFLEAACFDAGVIRKSSMRLKKRSESSARFEKSLDPFQIVIAIERFLKLLENESIAYKAPDDIVVVNGHLPKSVKSLEISHAFIEQLLGISLSPDFIIKTLKKLEFGVTHKDGQYQIAIPTFRATKDIAIKQDIVEEIGRFYGYDIIAPALPKRATAPFELTSVMRMRQIKQLCAYALQMREVYTYAFFDESFLPTINWQPQKALRVQEAVSGNWQQLVTSLVPNLCKTVYVHASEFDTMNFFEWAKIWPDNESKLVEKSCLAGIFVNQKQEIDFYEAKQKIDKIAQLLGITFDWHKIEDAGLAPWYLPSQTAYLMYQGNKIGQAGKANPAFFSKIATGDAFIFELDGDFLLSFSTPTKRYQESSKYPAITRDVSITIPLAISVKELVDALHTIDPKINAVSLIDFFQKPEWHDQKGLTFRIVMADPKATMTTSQADQIMSLATKYLQQHGAQIR